MEESKRLLRLQILKAHLTRANEQVQEAQIEKLQRALAYREQEAEFESNQARRAEIQKALEQERGWDKEKRRPSMFIFTDIFFDEELEKFACQHCGITAYGDTPAMACENFDHLWVFGK